jgi:3-methyladenine DNA glycosylase AlkD
MSFIPALETIFKEIQNQENAFAMSKYMKNNFSFFGIKTEERRRHFKAILKENQIEITANPRAIALLLFKKPEREFHYCAIEIVIKELKGNYKKEDIQFIEKLIVTNSWWDSVDTLAKYVLGAYLIEFPTEIDAVIHRLSHSENMWLNRSALLFQLGYKRNTDFNILKKTCIEHQTSKAFFIQKAIGWALREYAKTNPEAIRDFVLSSDLKPLSKKEALKNS